MPRIRRRRLLFWIIALCFTALLLAWFSLPVWFLWAARPAAKQVGIRFGSYERHGFGEFSIRNGVFTNKDVTIKVANVRALAPTKWIWHVGRQPSGRRNLAYVDGWSAEIHPAGGGKSSTWKDVLKAAKTIRQVQYWLPEATLTNGSVRMGTTVFEIPAAHWSGGHLKADLLLPDAGGPAVLDADLRDAGPYEIRVSAGSLELQVTNHVRISGSSLEIEGEGLYYSNRVESLIRFAPHGKLPIIGRVEAPDFSVPARLVKVPGYSEPKGALRADWRDGVFRVELKARMAPLTNWPAPPLVAEVLVEGTTNSAVVRSLSMRGDWIQAQLSRNLELRFGRPWMNGQAQLSVTADLVGQNYVPLTGLIQGEAVLSPAEAKLPRVDLNLTGTNMAYGDFRSKRLEIVGRLGWPHLRLERMAVDFEDSSQARVLGSMDVQSRLISDGEFHFHGPLARRWLPDDASYDSMAVDASVTGFLTNLVHGGTVRINGVRVPKIKPLEARASWRGNGTETATAEITGTTGATQFDTKLDVERRRHAIRAKFGSFVILKGGEKLLELQKPVLIALSREADGQSAPDIHVGPVLFEGTTGELSLEGTLRWPEAGSLLFSARRFRTDVLDSFTLSPAPPILIESATLGAGQTNGFLQGSLAASVTVITNRDIAASVRLDATETGLSISNLLIQSKSETVVKADGFLPLRIEPANPVGFFQMEPELAVKLRAEARPNDVLLGMFTRLTGSVLVEPQVTVVVDGTWKSPEGHIDATAKRAELSWSRPDLPTAEQLQLRVKLDRETAYVEEGEFKVREQRVSFSGAVPLGANYWTNLNSAPVPDWRLATGRVDIANAEIEPFIRLLPEVIEPQGRVSVSADLHKGLKMGGVIKVRGARTEPIADLGPIRDINLDLALADTKVLLEKCTAGVGGATVALSGQADLSGTNWMHGRLPPFQVVVRGTNVPLSRKPESIIRSDLRLNIAKTNGAPPVISGIAKLRDSYFLSDLGDLVPGKVASSEKRPPYFSIETRGLADWRLGVDVTGDEFLKVRSPLFLGSISANVRLQGTLKDPVALGDVAVRSGLVRFPFGSLEVEQGFITLTSQNPFQPQIHLTAGGKQYGYDIRMDVTGPVNAPVIQFNSTPPLNSEQIVLMITAGELPQSNRSFSTQQRAQTFGVFLGRDLLSRLGVGDTAQQRLTIRSGEELSEAGRPTYDLDYRLSERWSLTGEYDRFGDFNVGAKWRVLSK